MNSSIHKLLLAGEYICHVRYPLEYSMLDVEANRDRVNAWLGELDQKLVRIGESGAWFMAPERVSGDMAMAIKSEILQFRSKYGPAVQMLDYIRQTDVENPKCMPGDRIQLVELENRVITSTTLTSQLRTLIDVIYRASSRVDDRENLKRLMEHLRKDGYVHLVDLDTGVYQITGKIEQVYTALSFLDDHAVIDEVHVEDQLELGASNDDAEIA